ncbi:MAG: helix-turn-helix transcriptional regulator [Bacteroidetes bacterium]|nr:helix-turn-helix transcriptional regulator [Bacteroidota bacterium]
MIRGLRGLTQEQLASKINKTRAMVSNIEQTGKVNHYTLLSILKALSITENDLDRFDGKKSNFGFR